MYFAHADLQSSLKPVTFIPLGTLNVELSLNSLYLSLRLDSTVLFPNGNFIVLFGKKLKYIGQYYIPR